ncbi:DUF3124 domain-containing protein [Pleurocapsales cyanobacterium LEGE 06147]|nr:DUF3124 domain-containing protein [Pleurocapsales cyanobacterium LEGE 06147]
MKLLPFLYLAMAALCFTSCTLWESAVEPQAGNQQVTQSQLKVVTEDLEKIDIAVNQTIYVPIYSHIYYDGGRRILNLAATLSIRNTDLTEPIIITSVRYYDSGGKLVKQYLEQPIQLDALVSGEFFVARTDTSGGIGANFIVEWIAEREVSEPIVEAVMVGTELGQGISFISPGKVIKTQNN